MHGWLSGPKRRRHRRLNSSSFKIGRKLSKGTSVVQRVFSSVELEVQNPDEFKKEFSAA
jgi:hypothetical protein